MLQLYSLEEGMQLLPCHGVKPTRSTRIEYFAEKHSDGTSINLHTSVASNDGYFESRIRR